VMSRDIVEINRDGEGEVGTRIAIRGWMFWSREVKIPKYSIKKQVYKNWREEEVRKEQNQKT